MSKYKIVWMEADQVTRSVSIVEAENIYDAMYVFGQKMEHGAAIESVSILEEENDQI